MEPIPTEECNMETLGSKTGNGAFKVERDGDKFFVTIEDGSPHEFDNAAIAYDYCYERYQHLTGTMRGFSYLNACFELEPFVGQARRAA